MTTRRTLLAFAGTAPLWLAGCATPAAAAESPLGWAGIGPTTGGAGARPEHVFDVHDRAGLDAALRLGDTPKIIRVHRFINLCPGSADDYRDPAFDADAFDRAFDPATWGRDDPRGPLEEARKRSARRQAAMAQVHLPSNTTLVGAAPGAGFERGGFMLERVANIVIRDLRFADAYDHFPEWQPRDNGHGEWNSEYDNVSLRNAERVWVDHCHFDDGNRPDKLEPVRLGQRVQHHDGLLDITNGSDLVTVSWCRFQAHDKTMLIGSGDGKTSDEGKLRVTLHHNHFHGCKERTPRVRYGRVHVVANLFSADRAEDFGYSLGLGMHSRLVAEHNRWELPDSVTADQLIRRLKGSGLVDRDSRLNGHPVDLLAAWQAAHPGELLAADVGWRPDASYNAVALRPADLDHLADQIRAGAGPRRA
ncbi:pectate lyase family protein [Roseateles cellulosilyticus]|uniref:Polysaccharide lyase family 1 protein n=1 Tax=Pelomonas cellulosilytica TaxID=2906762 RepID=A0ABS8XPD9_9BURK|nr:polysaccharide lyase family 1 protein [Pelomonas sp. P8]MCE4554621.1 polysaccharide lyase family 1 protein [Pelomonas sp. P8]